MSVTAITLSVRRPLAEVEAEFEEMLNQAHFNGWSDKINCHGKPELYADYRQSPSQEEAAALCAGCPLLTLHRELVDAKGLHWTVSGGIAWVEGHPFVSTAKVARPIPLTPSMPLAA
jgi:hypothetical protein